MDELYLYSLIQDVKAHPAFSGISFRNLEQLIVSDIADYQGVLEKASSLASANQTSSADSLQSIFSNLEIRDQRADHPLFYGKKELSLGPLFFPEKEPLDDPDFANHFQVELQKIKETKAKIAAETFLNLIHKYGAALPSYKGIDVAFYDYVKLKASLAICLVQKEDTILLAGGGVSGIQKFLYDILRRHAAKNLKGRSFLVQLLADQVAQVLIKELGLYQANIVYASGGNFYLLVPGDKKQAFKALATKINRSIFDRYQTSVTLELECVEMNEMGLMEHPGEYWKILGEKIGVIKSQPFRAMFSESQVDNKSGFQYFFEPSEVGGATLRDPVTNEEIANKPTRRDPELGTILKSTFEQLQLGRQLKKVETLSVYTQNGKGYAPADLGVSYGVDDSPKGEHKMTQFIRLNDCDFMQSYEEGITHGFKFYGGNQTPVLDKEVVVEGNILPAGSPKLFEHLAEGTGRFTRLAFLRMDVDGLGKSIQETFNAANNSLARFSTFSRSLDYFFKGYLNHLWETHILQDGETRIRDYAQIIYAGGDDLFIVGRWDVIIEFAEVIRNEFRKWVGNHPAFTISGGITLVGPKFPISKASEMAGKAEDAAKAYQRAKDKSALKNAITFLGLALHWEFDYPEVKALKNELVESINRGVPKSLLSNIQAFYNQKAEQQKFADTESWRWRTAYAFARAGDRLPKGKKELAEYLRQLSIQIFTSKVGGQNISESKYEFFDLLNAAAKWAELELRKMDK